MKQFSEEQIVELLQRNHVVCATSTPRGKLHLVNEHCDGDVWRRFAKSWCGVPWVIKGKVVPTVTWINTPFQKHCKKCQGYLNEQIAELGMSNSNATERGD